MALRICALPPLRTLRSLKDKGLYRYINEPFQAMSRPLENFRNVKYIMKIILQALSHLEPRLFPKLYRGVHWADDNHRDRKKYDEYENAYRIGSPQTFAPLIKCVHFKKDRKRVCRS